MASIVAVIASTHHPFYYRASTSTGADRPPFADEWTRKILAQKAWKVETHILLESGPTRSATLSFISRASLLVKVIARTSSGAASPWSMR